MTSQPPDPSQPNRLDGMIRDIVNQVLSDPMSYPDPMIAWFQDQFIVSAPTTVNSSSSTEVLPA